MTSEKADKKKVFISLPMSGKREREIKEDKASILEHLAHFSIYENEIDIIDTYIKEEPPEGSNVRLWYLGKTIELLAQADIVVFAKNWEKARGCRIERECAKIYHVPAIIINDADSITIEE